MKLYYWFAKWMWLLGVFPETAQAMLSHQPEHQKAREAAADALQAEIDKLMSGWE